MTTIAPDEQKYVPRNEKQEKVLYGSLLSRKPVTLNGHRVQALARHQQEHAPRIAYTIRYV